jgi:hypothetical protein
LRGSFFSTRNPALLRAFRACSSSGTVMSEQLSLPQTPRSRARLGVIGKGQFVPADVD